MLVVKGAAGFFLLGANYALYGVAAMYYPQDIRGTGSGASVAVGRIGSIIGPSLAGVIVGISGSTESIFYLAVIPPLCACLAGFVLASFKPVAAKSAPAE